MLLRSMLRDEETNTPHLLKKNLDCHLKIHSETKNLVFGDMWSDEIKQKNWSIIGTFSTI